MEPNKGLRTFEHGVAVVTGGASGIGRSLSKALARRGCEVVIADRQDGPAREVASQITAAGGRAKAVGIDVTDFPALADLVKETVERTGRFDYLFNNAGIGIGGNVFHYGKRCGKSSNLCLRTSLRKRRSMQWQRTRQLSLSRPGGKISGGCTGSFPCSPLPRAKTVR